MEDKRTVVSLVPRSVQLNMSVCSRASKPTSEFPNTDRIQNPEICNDKKKKSKKRKSRKEDEINSHLEDLISQFLSRKGFRKTLRKLKAETGKEFSELSSKLQVVKLEDVFCYYITENNTHLKNRKTKKIKLTKSLNGCESNDDSYLEDGKINKNPRKKDLKDGVSEKQVSVTEGFSKGKEFDASKSTEAITDPLKNYKNKHARKTSGKAKEFVKLTHS